MSTDNTTLIRDGFEAFLRGDFDALRSLLAPDAQWLYWEPIPGDCHDPEKIIATLRERHDEGVVSGVETIVDGFHVTATHPAVAPDPDWASLEADEAQLMLARADASVVARDQAVLFYLFSRDLFGLRDRLVAAGIDAGEITDGRPGPNTEMRLEDPDGYVLMVAQIEASE